MDVPRFSGIFFCSKWQESRRTKVRHETSSLIKSLFLLCTVSMDLCMTVLLTCCDSFWKNDVDFVLKSPAGIGYLTWSLEDDGAKENAVVSCSLMHLRMWYPWVPNLGKWRSPNFLHLVVSQTFYCHFFRQLFTSTQVLLRVLTCFNFLASEVVFTWRAILNLGL